MFSRSFAREREKMALRLDEVIRRYLSDAGIPAVNDAAEDVFGDFAIGTFPLQREMRFFLGDVACFTPELISRLRPLVAEEFPEWTVVPQFNEHEFTVAPEGVIFRDAVVRGQVSEITPAYIEWLAAARAFDAKRFGPMRRQMRYLRPRLPAAVVSASEIGYATVAAFDFYVPYFWDGSPVVWVVTRPEFGKAVVEPGERMRASAVTSSGFVFPEHCDKYSRYCDVPPAAQLITCTFNPADRDRLLLVSDARQPVGQVVIDQILSDTEPGDHAIS